MGRTRWLPFAIVSLLAAAPYLLTPGFAFVFDDRHLIVDNPFLRDHASLLTAFAHHFWHGTRYGAAYYRPMVVASFALNGLLLGWGPAGFHLVNILLHAGNAMLLLALTRRVGCPDPAALAAAALFAVHPVAAWPVASVVARVDLLPAFFVLLAWLRLCPQAKGSSRVIEGPTHAGGWRAVMAGLFFLLALLSKESSVAFLAVPILGLRPMREQDAARSHRWIGAPLAAAVLIYLMLRRMAGLGLRVDPLLIDPLINPLSALPIAQRLPAAVMLCGRYLLYLLFPVRFHDPSNYLDPASLPGPLDSGVLLSLLVLLVSTAMVAVLWLRRDRTAVPLAFSIASFLPASNLIVPIASLYAQNFLYLPLIGLCLALGIAIGRASPARLRPTPAKLLAAFLLLGALAIVSCREARIWKDEVSLFGALSARFPCYAPAHSALGVALLDRGRSREAVGPLRKALALTDASLEAHYNLGVALILTARDRAGQEEALAHLHRSVELRPGFAPAHYQAARALLLLGQDAQAESEAREAARLDPDLAAEVKRLFGDRERRP